MMRLVAEAGGVIRQMPPYPDASIRKAFVRQSRAENQPQAAAIGVRLKQAREAASYKRMRLSREARITLETVKGIEAGRRIPHTSTLEKLAAVLKVDEEWLFSGTGNGPVPRAPS